MRLSAPSLGERQVRPSLWPAFCSVNRAAYLAPGDIGVSADRCCVGGPGCGKHVLDIDSGTKESASASSSLSLPRWSSGEYGKAHHGQGVAILAPASGNSVIALEAWQEQDAQVHEGLLRTE